MKKQIAIMLLTVLALAGCGKEIVEEVSSVANSTLQVRTRGSDDATVSYPVNVYVFQNEECKAVQTIGSEGQMLNMTLPEGTYTVCAIGGTGSTDYTLPAKEDALVTTAVALKEGKSLTDLMAAKATVTLTDGGTNTVTLGMERKVMLVKSIVINQIPTAATAVTVSIAPLWESLTIGTTYAGTTGTTTIALTKQTDGCTWQSTAEQYLLPPSSQPASITVSITKDGVTNSYTYSTADELEAGYKINIEGTYTEAVGVELTGTITGATWLGERTIRFDFNDSVATTNDSGNEGNNNNEGNGSGNTMTGEIPTVKTLYKGCFVLSVTDQGDYSEVVLVSPKECKTNKSKSAIIQDNQDLEDYIGLRISDADTDDFSEWRLPTINELVALYNAYDTANSLFPTENGDQLQKDYRYLYSDGETIKAHVLRYASTSNDTDNFGSTDLIRPFVTLTFSKE